MKSYDFTVITVCLNADKFLGRNIKSVRAQKGVTIEHVIQDGGSTDESHEILSKFTQPPLPGYAATIEIAKDRGIYDAMNKGFARSKGKWVCVLNADDHYASDDVLRTVKERAQNSHSDIVYGAARFVRGGKAVRVCDPGDRLALPLNAFKQIPHPALFVKSGILREVHGPFDSTMRISADYKLQAMLHVNKSLMWSYLPAVLVNIEDGGASTRSYSARFLGWRESARAYREVFNRTGCLAIVSKVWAKLPSTFLRSKV